MSWLGAKDMPIGDLNGFFHKKESSVKKPLGL